MAFGDHHFQLRPREAFDQRLRSFELVITPTPMLVRFRLDPVGNAIGRARFNTTADTLTFDARFEVDQTLTELSDLAALDAKSRRFPPAYSREDSIDLAAFIGMHGRRPHAPADAPLLDGIAHPVDPGAALRDWVRALIAQCAPSDAIDFLVTLTYAIKEGFEYNRREERGTQAPAETLRLRRGTCRDFAQLFVAAARSQGFAARFVSGYVGARLHGDGPVGGGATHAWAQVYLNDGGWVDFDPTNAIVGNRGLVRVSCVREPAQATPLHGTYFGGAGLSLGMEVEVGVTLLDPPGPTDHSPLRIALPVSS